MTPIKTHVSAGEVGRGRARESRLWRAAMASLGFVIAAACGTTLSLSVDTALPANAAAVATVPAGGHVVAGTISAGADATAQISTAAVTNTTSVQKTAASKNVTAGKPAAAKKKAAVAKKKAAAKKAAAHKKAAVKKAAAKKAKAKKTSTPSVLTITVYTTGGQAAVDACRGAVVFSPYLSVGVKALAQHWGCGGSSVYAKVKKAGTIVIVSGKKYRSLGVVARLNIASNSAKDIPRGYALYFQTCIGGSSANMAFVAFERA